MDRLENLLPGENRHPLLQLIKDCLCNAPSHRPTAEQLVTALEEMKADVERDYGELATVEAVRQVKITKAMKNKRNLLAAKDEEIQQLQEQLEVNLKTGQIFVMYYINHPGFVYCTCRSLKSREWSYAREKNKKM